jgi:4'-phosphopantetheinyl transferase EntD
MPASACAHEMFSDAPESTMFSIESAAVANAVEERRREFGTVRYCARKALLQIGMPAVPVLPDVDGAPEWPLGVVGSMTHCVGYRAATVAPSSQFLGVGIDAEPHAAVPSAALDLILRDEERARVLVLSDAHPDLHWDRIVFCAKETVYKAWFPLTRRWLDFTDVSTTVYPDGRFLARLSVGGARVSGVDVNSFGGRWIVGRGLVVAATWVERGAGRGGRGVGIGDLEEKLVGPTSEHGHVVERSPVP